MVFSSLNFIFLFLPVFLLLYFISPGFMKNMSLFIASLVFYFYGVMDNPFYMVLFLLSLIINHRIGVLIGRRRRGPIRKRWLIIGVVYNLSWLLLFKYSAFFVENLNTLFDIIGIRVLLPIKRWKLPIGISFYTFQAISYLADVYRKDVPYEKSFINFGMYISMFPQLIAGPIVTYKSIHSQITNRKHRFKNIEDGLRDFTLGLGLKVLLANRLGGLWNEVNGIGFESISTPLAWLGIIAFSLQIYFDFYGYSLMAKGLGRLLGFALPDNFNQPYMALSMTEFWRRWHITLGSWFREYIYIPLGGNRQGTIRTYLNMFVVWLLTGFWHGASWNFIIWGILLFLLISMEKLGLIHLLEKVPLIGHLYMMFIIPITWLFFAVTDLGQIVIYLQRLFPFLAKSKHFSYFRGDYLKYGVLYAFSFIMGLILITGLPMRLYERHKYSIVTVLLLLVIFWGSVYCMKIGLDDPFLYFRF